MQKARSKLPRVKVEHAFYYVVCKRAPHISDSYNLLLFSFSVDYLNVLFFFFCFFFVQNISETTSFSDLDQETLRKKVLCVQLDLCYAYFLSHNIVTWLLKHCPFHGNGSINKRVIARQRRAVTIELLRAVFSMPSVPRLYSDSLVGRNRVTRVEAGSNTSTMTLRVVGGDEKESLKTETVTYGREIQGTRTRERLLWRGPAAYRKDRPVLSSERAPHKNKTVTVKQ
jgi:hypothetical protein